VYERKWSYNQSLMVAPVTQPPIDHIVRKIAEAFHPRRIVLFGSRARGDARPDSDLDLLIEVESNLPPRARAVQVDALFGQRMWPMDIMVYTPEEVQKHRQNRNSLVSAAEREGKVLYERP
jgi:predicted nucleotidyltransferase